MLRDPDGATLLGPDEIEGLKFAHVTTRGELGELEQVNITEGLRRLARRRGGDVLAGGFVRLLHKRLFGSGPPFAMAIFGTIARAVPKPGLRSGDIQRSQGSYRPLGIFRMSRIGGAWPRASSHAGLPGPRSEA